MAKNTALGAEKSKKRNITFKNKEHEKFYRKRQIFLRIS